MHEKDQSQVRNKENNEQNEIVEKNFHLETGIMGQRKDNPIIVNQRVVEFRNDGENFQ